MAAPDSATLKNLNGKWLMNKTLSGDFDSVLSLQGIGWITRKAIGVAGITLATKQYEEDGVEHIHIDQIITGGLKGTSEHRTLDWQWREHADHIFGDVKGRTQWVKLADLSDADEDKKFMKTGWSQDVVDAGEVIESYVENEKAGWVANQHWGFEIINGERRYVRHVVVWNKKDKKRVKLVYDWVGN